MTVKPKVLTAAQVEQYHEAGFVSPIDVLTAAQAAEARAKLEAHEATTGGALLPAHRAFAQYLFLWVDEIMRHPRILDAVEDLIGPDLLCWASVFWVKEANSPSFVGWHQDLQYWGLETEDLVNVWVALAPASASAGCMSVLPGTQHERLEHIETYDEHSLLSRGQELTIDITARNPISMPLEAGQVSMHNGRLAHGSGPNETDDRRIGLSLQYVPTSAKQTLVEWDSANLVRGVDEFNHFEHGPRPTKDFDPECVAFHERAMAAMRDIIYKGAEQDVESKF